MKKFLSHIFPFTRKITSPVNGTLEITHTGGKKVLDSANANYSYGSLQRVLKFALSHTTPAKLKSVLVLGLGGGSVIETLRADFKYKGSIEAVDIDPVIIEIARTEFDIKQNSHLKVHCTDALAFLITNQNKYDLIIVDVFIDNKIPQELFTPDFWKGIRKSTSENGTVLFNTIEETTSAPDVIKDYMKQEKFELKILRKVESTNTVFIWERREKV